MFDLSQATVKGVTEPGEEPVRETTENIQEEAPRQEEEPAREEEPAEEPAQEQEPPQEQQQEAITEPANDFPADRFGGKFSSWDELESALQNPLKDDFIKKVVEKYNSDGSLKEFFEAYSTDYDKLGDEEILRRDFFRKNSDLNEKTVERMWKKELASKYNTDPDELSEEEIEDNTAFLKRDAAKLRETFKQEQAGFMEPSKPQVDRAQATEVARSVVEKDPEVNRLRAEKKVSFNIDGQDFNYEVGDPDAIVESMVDENRFFNTFLDGGKPDTAKWNQVMAIAQDPQKFVKTLTDYGRSLGRKEIEGELKNTKLPGTQPDQDRGPGDFKSRLLQAFADNKKTTR